MLVAICKVVKRKCKIGGEREGDEPLADDQWHIAYVNELDHDDQNRRVPDAHAGKRQVVRRLGLVNPFYLKKNIDVQGDVGQEREQVEWCHLSGKP